MWPFLTNFIRQRRNILMLRFRTLNASGGFVGDNQVVLRICWRGSSKTTYFADNSFLILNTGFEVVKSWWGYHEYKFLLDGTTCIEQFFICRSFSLVSNSDFFSDELTFFGGHLLRPVEGDDAVIEILSRVTKPKQFYGCSELSQILAFDLHWGFASRILGQISRIGCTWWTFINILRDYFIFKFIFRTGRFINNWCSLGESNETHVGQCRSFR